MRLSRQSLLALAFPLTAAFPLLRAVANAPFHSNHGSGAVSVVSDLFWQRRYDGSPSVLGKTIEVNRTPIIVSGVAPHRYSSALGFHWPSALHSP